MGANLSTPEKIAKCSRVGDATSLSALLSDLQRNDAAFRANRARYLEFTDENGNTPLTLAAARGHLPCVKLLLQHGANIHHVNSKADGGSALHEAVAHKHEAVVELLLAQGGNPFVENIKGFTAMDIACSTRNVPLLRRLEQCAPFVGWLLMKVPQFGGLGSSWQRRWVVVSHRYPNPRAPPARQLTHCVFLAYKTLASTAPSCRVWLDGARAREVYNPKAEARLQSYVGGGPRIAQAGITLHRKHELPSGVYTTGGHSVGSAVGGVPQEGYTFYLRPDDGSPMSVHSLDRLIRTINNRGFPPTETAAADGAGTSTPAPLGPLQAHAATLSTPAMATTPGTWGSGAFTMAPGGGSAPLPDLQTAESDEEIARRLQEQYDAEAAQEMQQQPSPPGRPGIGAATTQHQQRPQSASAPATATAAAAAAAGGPDYLTGGFYPPVHFDQQPGSAPGPSAAAASQPLYGTSSAPPHMAAAMQAAASGPQDLETLSRPSAPSLLDLEYPPPPGMPLGGGLAAVGGRPPPPAAAVSAPPVPQGQRPTEPPLSASGRRMSAPRLEDEAWWDGTPAVPPSRPASDPGDANAAAAAAAAASKPADSSDDSAVCVVCMDQPSTAGVLHGDSVHKCLCKECAAMLKESKVTSCPMCREHIEAFIMRVF